MRRAPLALALVLACLSGLPAAAQYFGRNKVKWERFDFRVLETEHFDVHYYPAEEEAVRDAAAMAERWYDRLSRVLSHTLAKRKPILLYADAPDFQQTNATFGSIEQGTGGFTEPLLDRVVLSLTGSAAQNDHVIGHELVHAFQFDIAATRASATQSGRVGLQNVPLWFVEGMAEYLSVGREDANTAMWLRDAVLTGDLPTLRELSTEPRYFPYRWGQAFWAFVAGRFGDGVIAPLFAAGISGGVERAVSSELGLSPEAFAAEWHAALRAAHEPVIAARKGPEGVGVPRIAGRVGQLNVGPVLSPDGDTLAFLSSRELFTVDVFLAETDTGRILGKLFKENADAHVDALRFVDSAGSWSPDGTRLAYAVYADGDNHLAIVDARRRRLERRLALADLGAFADPAWSPDGRSIVVSGQRGGVSDLYLVDVASGSVRALTQDAFADLHPAWSPDGTRIAFASDRGSNLQALRYAPLTVAVLTVSDRTVRVLDLPERGKAINPQFSPDGRALYYVSDADGISDVYRIDLETGERRRVTRTITGVSGITADAPALSVARDGTLAFSVFRDGDFAIYVLSPEQAAGTAPDAEPVQGDPALLPPAVGPDRSAVSAYLADPAPPDRRAAEVPESPYERRLRLLYVAPPAVGVGVDRFGSSVAGAATAYFSDLLGDQLLGVTFQAESTFDTLGGQVFWQNLKHRWQWGASVARIPYLSAGTRISDTVVDIGGTPTAGVLVEQLTQKTYLDSGSFIVTYPFSTRRRVEVSADVSRYSFDTDVQRFVVVGGQVVAQDEQALASEPGFTLYGGTAALVSDTSFFGFTAPVRGARWRLEAGSTAGDLSFRTLLLDGRRYFFRNPVTLAFRALHYGRYGTDAESDRIGPLFLGSGTLVRGYEADSFGPEDCTFVPEDPTACPEIDRLVGSRVAIANAELRFPLLGIEGYGLFTTRTLPIDLLAFVDAGVAWDRGDSPKLRWDRDTAERVPVASAGVGARFLLGGFIVLETSWAWPLHRREGGPEFALLFAPGW
jgi:Tol biopolymer transport system component